MLRPVQYVLGLRALVVLQVQINGLDLHDVLHPIGDEMTLHDPNIPLKGRAQVTQESDGERHPQQDHQTHKSGLVVARWSSFGKPVYGQLDQIQGGQGHQSLYR